MGDADFLTMFAAAIAANAFTALAIAGMVLFGRFEREAKEQGKKLSAPPYVYAMILLPIALGVASIYAVNSSGAAGL